MTMNKTFLLFLLLGSGLNGLSFEENEIPDKVILTGLKKLT